ncbi:hypothetical protein [Kitasatospora sp. NPDC057015]|uniref:hypothetical protein n=1 Tax=Kitasatospora sp. NPDC057015 TaxID=3346001 RepID=UPI0036396949
MEGRQAEPAVHAPAPRTQASLLAAIAEAVHDQDQDQDQDQRGLRLLQAAIAELRALRDALDPRHSRSQQPGSR